MALHSLTAMGDLISSDSDCTTGQASITGMDAVFQSAPATIQAQFQSAHDDIMNRYNQSWYIGINWIPFNSACSTIQTIGQQADALTRQIQTAMGVTPTPTPNPGGVDFQTVLIVAAVAYVALAALPSLMSRR